MLVDFLVEWVQAFVLAAIPVLVSILGLWMREKLAKARRDARPEVIWVLDEAARMAVLAAEQVFEKEEFLDKKAYAIGVVEKLLAAKGINFDLDLVDAAIEAAVKAELNPESVVE